MSNIDEAMAEYKARWSFFNEGFDDWLRTTLNEIDHQAREEEQVKEKEKRERRRRDAQPLPGSHPFSWIDKL